jgi:uncharacterized damage-inducible protein DinB
MPLKLTDFLLMELEREAVVTRRTLERVPEAQNAWKPHPRSMELGYLAALVATMPSWIASMVEQDELDIRSAGADQFKPLEWKDRGQLVAALEQCVARARQALRATNDEHLLTPWRFVLAGRVVSQDPRHVMIQDSVFNHLAHHRGQLTVYLRLNEASVPAIYGPSADEGQVA